MTTGQANEPAAAGVGRYRIHYAIEATRAPCGQKIWFGFGSVDARKVTCKRCLKALKRVK